ncbi:TetR family transcriptional regulator [Tamaricihabitans halophyticus]|uniref:TetR family transcriptional regulator n=2 Tax=Tamaricihabitans halophyticus TaxID=1262583 RepID=A0A4R2QIV8_9PSEU|nr:TetR family transcriptional regulator [Tamaricihabitans halophyticus]
MRELVDAGLAAIRERGADVGVAEVAARVGTSKAGVYRYFDSKAALHVAVCQRVGDTVADRVSGAMARERTARRKLSAAVDEYLRLIESDPRVYRFVTRQPVPDRAIGADPLAEASALLGERIAVQLSELFRSLAPPAAARPWGHGLVGMVRAAADQWLADEPRIPRAELAEYLTELAWSGLRPKVSRK